MADLTLPRCPADGVITSYDPADALGSIVLDEGMTVRFGRSACSFDPVVGNRVRVLAVELGALQRLRATRVDAVGPRTPTRSEVLTLIGTVLLGNVEGYSDWALARHVAREGRPDREAARQAIRTELVTRGVAAERIDEMVSLLRWAESVMNPPGVAVTHVVGDEADVLMAIDVALERGQIDAAEAKRLRQVVRVGAQRG